MRNDIERIRDALSFVPADKRDTWLRMGMAVRADLGDAGFDVWDEWRGDRGDDEAESAWNSASESEPPANRRLEERWP